MKTATATAARGSYQRTTSGLPVVRGRLGTPGLPFVPEAMRARVPPVSKHIADDRRVQGGEGRARNARIIGASPVGDDLLGLRIASVVRHIWLDKLRRPHSRRKHSYLVGR